MIGPYSAIKMLGLRPSSADHNDAFCGSVQRNMQFFAIRPSVLPNVGTPTDACPLGRVKALPLVDHHGARRTPKGTAAEELVLTNDPGLP